MWIRSKISPSVLVAETRDQLMVRIIQLYGRAHYTSSTTTNGFVLGTDDYLIVYNLVKKRKKVISEKRVKHQNPKTGEMVFTTRRKYEKPVWTAYVYAFRKSSFLHKEVLQGLMLQQNPRNFEILDKNKPKKIQRPKIYMEIV